MMLDEKTIRKQLQDITAALEKIEEQRKVLLSLLRSYETWLRLQDGHAAQPILVTVDTPPPPPPAPRQVGLLSLRQAVLKIVREARGEPIHISEIWKRVQALGATSNSRRPVNAVDFTLYGLRREGKPVHKVAPGIWRWADLGEDPKVALPRKIK